MCVRRYNVAVVLAKSAFCWASLTTFGATILVQATVDILRKGRRDLVGKCRLVPYTGATEPTLFVWLNVLELGRCHGSASA